MECTNCHKSNSNIQDKRTWWNLNGYHGISGSFCPDCFKLVVHNCWDEPLNPEKYREIFVKQQLIKSL